LGWVVFTVTFFPTETMLPYADKLRTGLMKPSHYITHNNQHDHTLSVHPPKPGMCW